MKSVKYFVLAVVVFATFSGGAYAFSDLPESHHHYFPMTYLNYEGVIDGYSDGTVRPDNLINRAELVKILVEGVEGAEPTAAEYANCFPDVGEEWYAPFVCFALEKGWVSGYPDGTFKPEQNVNKAEALKIIINGFGLNVGNVGNLGFSDTPNYEWYAPFLQVAVDKNLVEEIGGAYFNPTFFRSRGEVSLMVARIKQILYMNDSVYNDWIKAEFETFLYLDKLRRENGVTQKLKLNPILTGTARAHSQDMALVLGELSHEGSDGTQSYDRIKAALPADFPGRTGENVGRSTGDVFGAIKRVHDNIFMPEGDDYCNHRTTLLSTCLPFTEVGIGVYVKDGYTYFTEDFITTEYADVLIRDLDQLEVPSEYNNLGYGVTEADTYSYTVAGNCNGVSLRAMNYVILGVAATGGGGCSAWELALDPNDWQLHRDVDAELAGLDVFEIWFSDWTDPEKDRVNVYGSNGWQEVSGVSPMILEGEVKTVTFEKDGAQRSFELNYSVPGWVKITEK